MTSPDNEKACEFLWGVELNSGNYRTASLNEVQRDEDEDEDLHDLHDLEGWVGECAL